MQCFYKSGAWTRVRPGKGEGLGYLMVLDAVVFTPRLEFKCFSQYRYVVILARSPNYNK